MSTHGLFHMPNRHFCISDSPFVSRVRGITPFFIDLKNEYLMLQETIRMYKSPSMIFHKKNFRRKLHFWGLHYCSSSLSLVCTCNAGRTFTAKPKTSPALLETWILNWRHCDSIGEKSMRRLMSITASLYEEISPMSQSSSCSTTLAPLLSTSTGRASSTTSPWPSCPMTSALQSRI